MCLVFIRLTAVELTPIGLPTTRSVVAAWTCCVQLQSQPIFSQQSGNPCIVVSALLPTSMLAVWSGISIAEGSWQGALDDPEALSVDETAATATMAFCICNLVAAVARPDP